MQPSKGMPGVILYGTECRRAKAALEMYPTSISAGPDPDVRNSLERMAWAEALTGKLDTFTLSVTTAQKLGENILERAEAQSAQRIPSLLEVAPALIGATIAKSIRKSRQKRFGRQLLEMSLESASIAPEQVIPKR